MGTTPRARDHRPIIARPDRNNNKNNSHSHRSSRRRSNADLDPLHPGHERIPRPIDPAAETPRVDPVVELDVECAAAEEQGAGFVADPMARAQEGEGVAVFVDLPGEAADGFHADFAREEELVDLDAEFRWEVKEAAD